MIVIVSHLLRRPVEGRRHKDEAERVLQLISL